MKKIAALVETTQDRVATVKSGSTVLESSSSREPSAQLKSSASNTRNKACHKPSKSNYHDCVRGNSKEIFELFTNKLVFLCQCRKDYESDDDPDSSPH